RELLRARGHGLPRNGGGPRRREQGHSVRPRPAEPGAHGEGREQLPDPPRAHDALGHARLLWREAAHGVLRPPVLLRERVSGVQADPAPGRDVVTGAEWNAGRTTPLDPGPHPAAGAAGGFLRDGGPFHAKRSEEVECMTEVAGSQTPE